MEGSAFLPVAQAIAAQLADVPPTADAIGEAVEHLRRAAADAVPRPAFDGAPARDYAAILDAAIREAGVAGVARPLAGVGHALPWHYHYAPRPGEADLAESIAFAELIGPHGPLWAPDCRIGFTLMAPRTFYPLHTHPAVELYLVIAGEAQWTTPDADRIVPPGQFVLHRSNEPHAMRTFADPLLALYAWRGDLFAPAVYTKSQDGLEPIEPITDASPGITSSPAPTT